MALPKYDKNKRRRQVERLPKGAYVCIIKNAREDENRKGGGTHLTIAFDIAEGEYKNFYQDAFDRNSNEDKKWPMDAVFYLNVPGDDAKQWAWDNWNTFFADLEDSNNGFVFDGNVKRLKNKLIGGKFHIEQSEYDGKVYNHTRLKWTCVADDVRNGKFGQLPEDKLVKPSKASNPEPQTDSDGFMNIPEDTDEEIPF